jgi:hypothetical protein
MQRFTMQKRRYHFRIGLQVLENCCLITAKSDCTRSEIDRLSLRDHYEISLQSLRNRCEIVTKSLRSELKIACVHFHIDFQMLSNRRAIVL